MSPPSWYDVSSAERLETSALRLNIADEMSLLPPSPSSSPLTSLTDLLYMRDWETAMNHLIEHPTEACQFKMLSLYGELGDKSRALPLHLACTLQPPSFVVEKLVEAYPEGIKTKEEKWGRLPLHFACIKEAGVDILTVLIDSHPDAAEFKDDEGRIPIHHACCWGNSEEVRLLLMAFPRSIHARDQCGKTPYDVTQMSGNPNKNSILRELQNVLQDALTPRTQLESSVFYQPEFGRRQNVGRPHSMDSSLRQLRSPRSTSFKHVALMDAERATNTDHYLHQSLGNLNSRPFDDLFQERRRSHPVSSITIEQQTSTTSSLPHPSTIDNLIEKLVSTRIELSMQQRNIVQIDSKIDHLGDQKQQLTQDVTQCQTIIQSKFNQVSEHKGNLKMYTEELEALLKRIDEEQRQLSNAEQELEKETEDLSSQEEQLKTMEEEKCLLMQQRDCLLRDIPKKTEFVEELDNELKEHLGICGVRGEDVNFSCIQGCQRNQRL